MPIVMAGEVTEPKYFEEKIKPLIDGVEVQLAQHENMEHIVAFIKMQRLQLCRPNGMSRSGWCLWNLWHAGRPWFHMTEEA